MSVATPPTSTKRHETKGKSGQTVAPMFCHDERRRKTELFCFVSLWSSRSITDKSSLGFSLWRPACRPVHRPNDFVLTKRSFVMRDYANGHDAHARSPNRPYGHVTMPDAPPIQFHGPYSATSRRIHGTVSIHRRLPVATQCAEEQPARVAKTNLSTLPFSAARSTPPTTR